MTYGINGDFVESQAFAFSSNKINFKTSNFFSETTRCVKPCSGGELIEN